MTGDIFCVSYFLIRSKTNFPCSTYLYNIVHSLSFIYEAKRTQAIISFVHLPCRQHLAWTSISSTYSYVEAVGKSHRTRIRGRLIKISFRTSASTRLSGVNEKTAPKKLLFFFIQNIHIFTDRNIMQQNLFV